MNTETLEGKSESEARLARPRIEALCKHWGISFLGPLKDFHDQRPEGTFNPSVYFLCDGDEIFYIGKSRMLERRISSHRKSGRKFSYVLFLDDLPELQAPNLEREFIRTIKPHGNAKTDFIPIDIADIVRQIIS